MADDGDASHRHVTLPLEAEQRIDVMVAAFVDDVVGLEAHSGGYRRRVEEIDQLAAREIRSTSAMSGRLLERPAAAMGGPGDDDASLTRSLSRLRRGVEALNPGGQDLTHIRTYLDRYEKAKHRIEQTVAALDEDSARLRLDNAAIAQDQKALQTETETLRQYAYFVERLDAALDARIASMTESYPERARTAARDVLYPVRRRREGILTQLAVAVQGRLALDIVASNNRELIRVVHLVTSTTLAALRTALAVAQALEQQQQGRGRLAAAGANLGSLQRAWDDVLGALQEVEARQPDSATKGQNP